MTDADRVLVGYPQRPQRRPTIRERAIGCVLVAVVVLALVAGGAFLIFGGGGGRSPMLVSEKCLARAGGNTVAVDLEQARLAALISGVSVKRGLPPRAASIALATVYQETGIRNLDYGDRDSVGLFQQRPSQGWGTPEQIMDPYYATGKFYDALIKVKNWESDDLNDVAQKVQRSGFPEAYRDHEADGRTLASALTGQSPASFSCLERREADGDPTGLARSLEKTFGPVATSVTQSDPSASPATDPVITVKAADTDRARAHAHYAIATAAEFGVTSVQVGDQLWRTDPKEVPVWTTAEKSVNQQTVRITLRP